MSFLKTFVCEIFSTFKAQIIIDLSIPVVINKGDMESTGANRAIDVTLSECPFNSF